MKPDLLDSYDNAPEGFRNVLRDAESRIQSSAFAEQSNIKFEPRISDIQIHTQRRRQHENVQTKVKIMRDATNILQNTVNKNDATSNQRFEEALCTLRAEERRSFVTVVRANTATIVYWNWQYAYSLKTRQGREHPEIRTGLQQRIIATPEQADAVYGDSVIDKATPDPFEG